MTKRKLFIILFLSAIFLLLAMFYFSSGKDIAKDSEEVVLLNPLNSEVKSDEQKVFNSFFKTVGFEESKEEELLNHPTEEQLKFMSDEVYDNFNSETGADIIIILKDYNEYVSDTYNEDYDKKKEEIKILMDKFLSSFSEDELQVIYKGEVTKFIAVHVNSIDVLKRIEKHELFDYFFLDKKQELHLLESKQSIGLNNFQARYRTTGRNVAVCVIDSGVDYAHPAFGSCGLAQVLAGTCPRVIGGIDFQSTTSGGTDNDPLDPIIGHGTQVAGIISSNDPTVKGIAPEADIVAVKIFHGPVGGGFSATMAGIDWCINNRNSFRSPIKIISMSFGGGSYDSSTTPFYYDSSFVTARAAGMFLDASSGNGASSTGISYPASSPLVFSVGSFYDADLGLMSFPATCEDLTTNVGKISCFTNRYDLLDILAPGSSITTTTTGGFTTVSGTSVAAAHVAAVAALLFSYNPNYSPADIENLMRNTGFSTYDPSSTYSYPLLNLNRIFNARANPVINLAGEPNAGSSIDFSYFDPKNANQNYLVLLSGANAPGITLPTGVIPLAFDIIMYNALLNPGAYSFFNSFGPIDSFGYGRATLDIDPNIPPGTSFYVGAVSYNNMPFPNNIIGIASKSIKVTTLPQVVDVTFHSNLPGHLVFPSCVNNFFDGKIYCLGGSDQESSSNPLDQILEFDPITGSLTVNPSVTTPAGIVGSSCVNDFYTNSGLLCFGGFSNTGGRWVFSYDTINQVVTTKLAVLPYAHWRATSCAAYPFPQVDDTYCFGGFHSNGYINSIIRYSASTDTFNFMTSTLPEEMSYMSCVSSFVHGKIYCFGGAGHTSGMPSSKILEYDPLTDTLTTKSARLPQGLERLSCAENMVTNKIYCFGGRDINLIGYPDRVLEYDPLTDTLQTTYTRIDPGREGLSCTFSIADSKIYCFGGEQVDEAQGSSQQYDEVLVY